MRGLAASLVFLSVAALPASSLAQSGDAARARALFMEGRRLAGEERWDAALDSFESSLALVERASTMVSIANVLVRLGRGRDALAMLDRLQASADPRRDRRHLRAAAALRPRAEEIAATEPPPAPPVAPVPVPAPAPEPEPVVVAPPPAPAPPPERDVLGDLIGPIVVAGAGALAFGAMGIFIGLRGAALSERDRLCPAQACPDEGARQEALARHADADTFTVATNVAWIGGAALLAVGATWGALALALGGPSDDVALTPALGPTYAGVRLGGRLQ